MNEKTLSKADIQKEREALLQRLADLDAAERVMDGWQTPATTAFVAPWATPKQPETGAGHSIKQIILREAGRPGGVSASEAAAVIAALKSEPYPVTNVSPKLSLYGSHGLIVQREGRWHLTTQGAEELALSTN